MLFTEGDSVLVTGTILGTSVQVVKLRAEVATAYPEDSPFFDEFKVWPWEDRDPQLTKELQEYGKLWFSRKASEVEVVE